MQIYSEQIAGFDELNQKCKEQQTQLNKQKKLL